MQSSLPCCNRFFLSDRQTLLFSATLPKLLVEFSKAGLNDPALIRLDVDTKISDLLKVSNFLLYKSFDREWKMF